MSLHVYVVRGRDKAIKCCISEIAQASSAFPLSETPGNGPTPLPKNRYYLMPGFNISFKHSWDVLGTDELCGKVLLLYSILL